MFDSAQCTVIKGSVQKTGAMRVEHVKCTLYYSVVYTLQCIVQSIQYTVQSLQCTV